MNIKHHIQADGMVGLAAWTGQSRGMQSAHQHLDLEINYVLSGTMCYLVGGRVVELPPHRMCLLWGGVVHQMIRNLQPVEAIWVTVPLAQVLRWGLPDRIIRPLLATGLIVDPTPLSGDLDLLHQWISDLAAGEERLATRSATSPIAAIVLLEIEARLRRCAIHLARKPSETGIIRGENDSEDSAAHNDRGLAAVEAMAQFMSQNFQEEIDVAAIAQPAHLHPNYAMALFRQHSGMTISRYLTLQRVAHAQRLLATTADPIDVIALNSGFRSVSRFYEAFRQQTGNSPRRFRLHMKSRTNNL